MRPTEERWTPAWMFLPQEDLVLIARDRTVGETPWGALHCSLGPRFSQVQIIPRDRMEGKMVGRALSVMQSMDASDELRKFAVWCAQRAMEATVEEARSQPVVKALAQRAAMLEGAEGDELEIGCVVLFAQELEPHAGHNAALAACTLEPWRAARDASTFLLDALAHSLMAGRPVEFGGECRMELRDSLASVFNSRFEPLLSSEAVA